MAKQVSPNTLGRVLRYFTNAAEYARVKPAIVEQRRRMSLDIVQRLAGSGDYSRLIDSSDAELLAITSYAVYRSLATIGSRVGARAAWPQAKRKSGESLLEVKNHEFEQLLAWPNDQMSYSYIVRYAVGWYLLRGSAHIFMSTPKVGRGPVVELWPLESNRIKPMPETLRRSQLTGRVVMDFVMESMGKKYTLPGENVMSVRCPNWWNYWEGLSSLTAGMSAIRTDAKQAKWQEDWYGKDNAVPTAIISLPEDISDTDYEAAKEAIKEQFGESRSSAITRAGDLDVKVIQQTLEEMQLITSREFNRNQIYQIYGVPLPLVTGEMASENIYAVAMTFAQNVIQPILDEFAAQWTIALRPYYGDDFVAESPNIIPQDRALEVQEYSQYGQDRTINENRDKLGLKPLEGWYHSDVAVRILRHVFKNPGHPAGDAETGTLPAAEDPEEMSNRLTDDGTDTEEDDTPENQGEHGEEAAKAAAVRAAALRELKAWSKVAQREIDAGHDALNREFVAGVLDQGIVEYVRRMLVGVSTSDALKAVFDSAKEMLSPDS